MRHSGGLQPPCGLPRHLASADNVNLFRSDHIRCVANANIMWILPLVGYVGILVGFGFLTLAIGSSTFMQSSNNSVFASRRVQWHPSSFTDP